MNEPRAEYAKLAVIAVESLYRLDAISAQRSGKEYDGWTKKALSGWQLLIGSILLGPVWGGFLVDDFAL